MLLLKLLLLLRSVRVLTGIAERLQQHHARSATIDHEGSLLLRLCLLLRLLRLLLPQPHIVRVGVLIDHHLVLLLHRSQLLRC